MDEGERLDPPFVELHRLPEGRATVQGIEGPARRLAAGGGAGALLALGELVQVGEAVFLAPGASIDLGARRLGGGRHGRAHAFVAPHAFRASPGRAEVPRLVHQLRELELQLGAQGARDPLADQDGPSTPHERAVSAEFARANLVLEEARALPAPRARALAAVPLFFADEAAFVAVEEVSLSKLRTLMEVLGRPVNPHLVERAVLDELQARVYGPWGAAPA